MAGFEGDELAPPQAGVDGGLDHQPMLGGKGGEDGGVLVGRQGAGFFLITLGSSVAAQGLKVTTRSRRARSKIECSMVWYFRTLAAGAVPSLCGGGGDPALDLGGQDLAHRPASEGGDEVLVEVGPVHLGGRPALLAKK